MFLASLLQASPISGWGAPRSAGHSCPRPRASGTHWKREDQNHHARVLTESLTHPQNHSSSGPVVTLDTINPDLLILKTGNRGPQSPRALLRTRAGLRTQVYGNSISRVWYVCQCLREDFRWHTDWACSNTELYDEKGISSAFLSALTTSKTKPQLGVIMFLPTL